MTEEQAYEQGRQAWRNGRSDSTCPHESFELKTEKGSFNHLRYQWLMGWHDEDLKRFA